VTQKIKFLVDLNTGIATSAVVGRRHVAIRKEPLPHRLLLTVKECARLGSIPPWAEVLGFESVDPTGDNWSIILSMMTVDEFAPRLRQIDNPLSREKLESAHADLAMWLGGLKPHQARSPAERSAMYREKMVLAGRKMIQVKVREDHDLLVRELMKNLLHDKSGKVENKLRKIIGWKPL
jgi:hypothetical protein